MPHAPAVLPDAPSALLSDDAETQRRIQLAILMFVVLGLSVRLLRFVMHFPLWADEAMLAANFLDADYLDMVRPLKFWQVSPILYLWSTLSIVKVVGFTEYSLRLFSCVCAMASVLVFHRLARRLLSGLPLLFAVAIFAVSYYPVRFASEVKPYASDLLTATVLLWVAVAWWQDRSRSRLLWIVACLAPLAIGLSYPAIFILGGILLGLAWPAWHTKLWRVRVAFLAAGVSTVVAFLVNYRYVVQAQFDASTPATQDFWAEGFPPLTNPVGLVIWFFQAHTGRMFGYPVGAENGGSLLWFALFVTGALVWWRSGRRALLGLMLAPFVLLFVAAVMHRYPYGGSGRISQHLVPAIVILMSAGIGWWLGRMTEVMRRQRLVVILVSVLLVFGMGQAVATIGWPYHYASDQEDRELSQQLWADDATKAVVVCAVTDLGLPWLEPTHRTLDGAKYLCNQRIYSHRLAQRRHVDWTKISDDKPLRVVMPFWPNQTDADLASRQAWLAGMATKYRHVKTTDYLTPKQRRTRARHSNGWWVRVEEFQPLHDEAGDVKN